MATTPFAEMDLGTTLEPKYQSVRSMSCTDMSTKTPPDHAAYWTKKSDRKNQYPIPRYIDYCFTYLGRDVACRKFVIEQLWVGQWHLLQSCVQHLGSCRRSALRNRT